MTTLTPMESAKDPKHFRAFERRKVPLSSVVWFDDGTPTQHAAVTLDVSLGGLCLELEVSLPTEARVVVELSAPNLWDPLLLRGIVIWTRPVRRNRQERHRHGIRFEHDSNAPLYALFETIHLYAFEER